MEVIMKFLKIRGLILFMVLSYSVNAQEILNLSLNKSVDLALQNNPSLKMAEKEASMARAGIWEAYSNILPQLDLSANFQHAWEIQTSKIPNFLKPMLGPLSGVIPELSDMPDYVEIAFGLENTFVYGGTVTQPLFLGGAGIAGIQAAGAGRRAAVMNLEEQRQDLIYQTSKAFYVCLLAKKVLEVQEEALSQTKANLDIVSKKYEVGSASGFDKMRAEVEVANLMPEVIAAKNNYQSTLTQLKTVLGLERDTIIKIEGQLTYEEDEFGNMSLADIQALALQNRPLVNAFDAQKYIVRKGVTLARSAFMPKLFFQTDLSYMDMRNDYKFQQANFSKGFTSSVSLQIPLFHGFRSAAQYQKARLDYKKMLDSEKQLHDGVAAEAEVIVNKYQEAKQKYQSSVRTVDLANEALRLANLMYEEGANTQLDVLNSQLALTRAKLIYINSLYEYQVSRYHLRKSTGRLTGVL